MIDTDFDKPFVPEPEEYKSQKKDAITREDMDRIFLEDTTIQNGKPVLKMVLSPTLLSNLVCERFFPLTWNNTLYYYDVESGLYVEDKLYIAGWVQSILTAAYTCTSEFVDGTTKEKYNVMVYNLPKNQKFDPIVKEVMSQVMRNNIIPGNSSPFNLYNGIPLGNCVLTIDEDGNMGTESYKPSMMFTHKVQTNYNPDADVEPVISILKQWIPDTEEEDENGNEIVINEKWEVLVQIPAQAIYQSLPIHSIVKMNFYMLVGGKDAGKSAYGKSIYGLFGEGNYSTVLLQNLCIPCYLAKLPGKFLNYGDDLYIVGAKDFNNIRTLSGTEKHEINQKFKPVSLEVLKAVHVYSTNLPPEVANLSPTNEDAFWGRWYILDFTQHFEEDSTWNSRNLTKDFYEGFLLLSLAFIRNIIKNNGDVPHKQNWAEVKQRWTCDLSPFHQFVKENLIINCDGSKHILKDDLFECFNTWKNQYFMKGESPEEKAKKVAALPKNVSELTKRLSIEGVFSKQIRLENGGERKWVYRYVDYNPDCKCKIRNGTWSND